MSLDCYVDVDYAGNWNVADADDPRSVRSCAGYLILLGGVPSKRIQEICLSTMESEYISLLMDMHSLIYLHGLLFEGNNIYNVGLESKLFMVSTAFKDNRAAQILATTDPPCMTPRSKSLAVKYQWCCSMLLLTTIIIKLVPSADNTSDIFMKTLPFDAFARHHKTNCGW